MGVMQLLPQKGKSVAERVTNFLQLTYGLNSDIHEPNYLVVQWAGLFEPFNCRLSSVDIHYTNIDRDGTPLRASLDIILLADELTETILKTEDKKSPDVSHSRIVRAGDTLPLLAKEIYGSSDYYMWVAKANGLDDIRRLTPGQRLVFPPLELKTGQ
jgi:nucleoid-associated protein YgaU